MRVVSVVGARNGIKPKISAWVLVPGIGGHHRKTSVQGIPGRRLWPHRRTHHTIVATTALVQKATIPNRGQTQFKPNVIRLAILPHVLAHAAIDFAMRHQSRAACGTRWSFFVALNGLGFEAHPRRCRSRQRRAIGALGTRCKRTCTQRQRSEKRFEFHTTANSSCSVASAAFKVL